MKRHWILSGLIFAVTAGCTTNFDNQQQNRFLRDQAIKDVTCRSETDCQEKWKRALQWVNANSYWRVKNVSDTEIRARKTTGAYSSRTLYRVQKIPSSDGGSRIELHANCLPAVNCVPNPVIAKGSFNYFVNTGKELALPNG